MRCVTSSQNKWKSCFRLFQVSYVPVFVCAPNCALTPLLVDNIPSRKSFEDQTTISIGRRDCSASIGIGNNSRIYHFLSALDDTSDTKSRTIVLFFTLSWLVCSKWGIVWNVRFSSFQCYTTYLTISKFWGVTYASTGVYESSNAGAFVIKPAKQANIPHPQVKQKEKQSIKIWNQWYASKVRRLHSVAREGSSFHTAFVRDVKGVGTGEDTPVN